MMQSVNSYAAEFSERPDSDDSSDKKSKKKKKKHGKDSDHHKHKKSKHRKERRSSHSKHDSRHDGGSSGHRSSGSRRESFSDQVQVVLPGSSFRPNLGQHFSPTTLWPVTAVPGGGYQLVPSNTSSPISLPGVQGNLEGTFKYLGSSSPLATPVALGVQTAVPGQLMQSVQLSTTPPISPGAYIHLRPFGNVSNPGSLHIQNNYKDPTASVRNELSSSNNIPISRTDSSVGYQHPHASALKYSSANQQALNNKSLNNDWHQSDGKNTPETVNYTTQSYNLNQQKQSLENSDIKPQNQFPDRGFGSNIPDNAQYDTSDQSHKQAGDKQDLKQRHTDNNSVPSNNNPGHKPGGDQYNHQQNLKLQNQHTAPNSNQSHYHSTQMGHPPSQFDQPVASQARFHAPDQTRLSASNELNSSSHDQSNYQSHESSSFLNPIQNQQPTSQIGPPVHIQPQMSQNPGQLRGPPPGHSIHPPHLVQPHASQLGQQPGHIGQNSPRQIRPPQSGQMVQGQWQSQRQTGPNPPGPRPQPPSGTIRQLPPNQQRQPPPNILRPAQQNQARQMQPNQMRQPQPNQMKQPQPNQMRQPQPNQMRQPPPNQMRQPPPNQMRQPPPNQMRQPPPNQMRQPPPNQMRQPPPNQMRQPPPNQMRQPPPNQLGQQPLPNQLGQQPPHIVQRPPQVVQGPRPNLMRPPPGHPDHNRQPLPGQIGQLSQNQMRQPPPNNRGPPPNQMRPPPGLVRPPLQSPNVQHPSRLIPPQHPDQVRQPPPHLRQPPPQQIRHQPPNHGGQRMPPPVQFRPPNLSTNLHQNASGQPDEQQRTTSGQNIFPPNRDLQQKNNFSQSQPGNPNQSFWAEGFNQPSNHQGPLPSFKPNIDVRPTVSQYGSFNSPTAANFPPPQQNLQSVSTTQSHQQLAGPLQFPPGVRPDFSKPPPNFMDPTKLPQFLPPTSQTLAQPNTTYGHDYTNYVTTQQDVSAGDDQSHKNFNAYDYNQTSSSIEHQDPLTTKANTLGTADYTKIVQALETLKSGKPNDKPSDMRFSVLETEPISPPTEEKEKDKDKKRKKEKKHKKEKKKKREKEKKEEDEETIEKRLQEKLAELATLNEEDTNTSNTPGSLSIQLNPKPSKFNLKIESPVMKGNIFQKYKSAQLFRIDSPMFSKKNHDLAERKYRKGTEEEEDGEEDEQQVNNQKGDNEDGLKTKEDLLKMLGIAPPVVKSIAKDDPGVIHSGSEDGEVLSDDEMEERKRIKDIIQTAKEEALQSNSPPSSVVPTSSAAVADPLSMSQIINKVNGEKFKAEDHSDSSDGEVSSDGELSDDSVDEFGRSKKLRGDVSDNEDDDEKYRQKGYSSGSDTSVDGNSDAEGARWGRSLERPASRGSKASGIRSRSVSASPERLSDNNVRPNTLTTNNEMVDSKEDIPHVEEQSLPDEEEAAKEAAEKERLHLEVQQLEGAIDTEYIGKHPTTAPAAESSASDVSDRDDDEDDQKGETALEKVTPIPITQEAIQNSMETDSNIPVRTPPEFTEKENLKRILMAKLYEKQKEEAPESEKSEENEIKSATKDKENKSEKFVDIFADSGDEGGLKESDDENEHKETSKESVDVEMKDSSLTNVNTLAVEKEMDKKESQESQPAEENTEENYESTLETLSTIRNNMEHMTKEELEEALKKLPSMNDVTEPTDGRSTPIHLRDIEIPVKSLTEYVTNKRGLYKQCFRNVNKREFKFMVPKYLRKFELKTVRNWCLDEIEIMSKKRLKSILLQQYLGSSSSESEDEDETEKVVIKQDEPKPVPQEEAKQEIQSEEKVEQEKEEGKKDKIEDNADQKKKKKDSKKKKKNKDKDKSKKAKKKQSKSDDEQKTDFKENLNESVSLDESIIKEEVITVAIEEDGGVKQISECDNNENIKTEEASSADESIPSDCNNSIEQKENLEKSPITEVELTKEELSEANIIQQSTSPNTVVETVQSESASPVKGSQDSTDEKVCDQDQDTGIKIKTESNGENEEGENTETLCNSDSMIVEGINEPTAQSPKAREVDVDNQQELKAQTEEDALVPTSKDDETSSSSSSDDDDDGDQSEDESGSGSDSESSASESKKSSVSASDNDGLENISSLDEKDLQNSSSSSNEEEAVQNDDNNDEEDDEDDDEDDKSSESADDESSDAETKVSRKGEKKREKRSQSESNSESSSSESTEHTVVSSKSRRHRERDSAQRRQHEKLRASKEKSSESNRKHGHRSELSEKEKRAREKYMHEKEKRRREKERKLEESLRRKLHRKQTKKENDSSDEEESSEEEEEEEDDEEKKKRRKRIKRYYLEKERRKRETAKHEQASKQERRQKGSKEKTSSSSSSEQSTNDSSSAESAENEDDDYASYRKQMNLSSNNSRDRSSGKRTRVAPDERKDFMKYLAQKKKREQDKKELRRKSEDDYRNQQQQQQIENKNNRNIQQANRYNDALNKQMPEGYAERKRLRDMQKRREVAPAAPGQRNSSDDPRKIKERLNRLRMNSNEQKLDRSIRSRSNSESRGEQKRSRETSINKRSREGSLGRRSREITKRKHGSRSNSRDSTRNDGKRKRRKNASVERKKFKELEFRARALESLLSKKEETNKSMRRYER